MRKPFFFWTVRDLPCTWDVCVVCSEDQWTFFTFATGIAFRFSSVAAFVIVILIYITHYWKLPETPTGIPLGEVLNPRSASC
jgi:hypothetical protein